HVFNACLVQGNHVRVALHKQAFVFPVNGMAGEVCAVKDLAFQIDLIFRRIDVLRRLVVGLDQPGTKANDLAAWVMYGKDDTIPVIINQLVVSFCEESRLKEQVWVKLACQRFSGKGVSLIRRIAQLELLYDSVVETSFMQVTETDIFSCICVQ